MKSIWACTILLLTVPLQFNRKAKSPVSEIKSPAAGNLFIITTDGFRWQEVFDGADSLLINNEDYTPDKETIKTLYWAATPGERRKKLMPFFWNIINNKGQLYGNRHFNNKVNTANLYSISYPGYNELFTGNIDLSISTNKKHDNPNINILEWLVARPGFQGKIAIFSSWEVFPYILNKKRNGLPFNSGYENIKGERLTAGEQIINKVQDESIDDKGATRWDDLTFLAAKEYIRKQHPRVCYLALGETDEFAHQGRYDLYLEQANKVDQMIADLWHWVQTTPGYRDNTTFIITTDHGRGFKPGKWTSHGALIGGASQTWLALIGPYIKSSGEVKQNDQIYAQQLASTIAAALGEEFSPGIPAAPALSLR